jgi:hypothetical protein
MALLIANCPRCGAQDITFEVLSQVYLDTRYGWQNWHEAFSLCRRCHRTTTFVIALSTQGRDNFRRESDELQKDYGKIVPYKGALNDIFKVEGYVSQKDKVKFSALNTSPFRLRRYFMKELLAIRLAVITRLVRCFGFVLIWRRGHFYL